MNRTRRRERVGTGHRHHHNFSQRVASAHKGAPALRSIQRIKSTFSWSLTRCAPRPFSPAVEEMHGHIGATIGPVHGAIVFSAHSMIATQTETSCPMRLCWKLIYQAKGVTVSKASDRRYLIQAESEVSAGGSMAGLAPRDDMVAAAGDLDYDFTAQRRRVNAEAIKVVLPLRIELRTSPLPRDG
jgi:hypothetical protein